MVEFSDSLKSDTLAMAIHTNIYVNKYALHNHAASCMYHIIFIKTENIAIDGIRKIICSHLLARAHAYFLYKIVMHAWRSDVRITL